MSIDFANSPMTPIGIPPEARAARPDTRALHVGPPRGMTEDECGTVESLVGNFSGLQAYADYWRPDAEQLATLNAGGFIELVQWTPRMMMHALSVWAVEATPSRETGQADVALTEAEAGRLREWLVDNHRALGLDPTTAPLGLLQLWTLVRELITARIAEAAS